MLPTTGDWAGIRRSGEDGKEPHPERKSLDPRGRLETLNPALTNFQPWGVKNSGPLSGANLNGAWIICAPIFFWSIFISAGDPKSKPVLKALRNGEIPRQGSDFLLRQIGEQAFADNQHPARLTPQILNNRRRAATSDRSSRTLF